MTTATKTTTKRTPKQSAYELIDLVPLQKELQKYAKLAVDHVSNATGGMVRGQLLISLDYQHTRRDSLHGHFHITGWMKDGNYIATIAINPYDLANRTGAEIFGTVLHEAIHFVCSFTENKIVFGFRKSTNLKLHPDGYESDTSRGGRYHGKHFKVVASIVPWLECFKIEDAVAAGKIGHATKLSAIGIKAAAKIVTTGIFDGLHKVIEPKATKKSTQYVGYICQEDGCKFSSQVSGGIATAIDTGTEDISQHHGLDMVKK